MSYGGGIFDSAKKNEGNTSLEEAITADSSTSIDTWYNHIADNFNGGDGTELNPYQIATPSQFARLSYLSRDSNLSNIHYKLVSNINMDSYIFQGIGTNNFLFKGVFDGDFYTLKGVTTYTEDTYAIFNDVEGTIKNLIVKDCTINVLTQTVSVAGGLVGRLNGSLGELSNCILDNVDVYFPSITNTACYVGGVAGSGSNIKNCIYKNSTIISPTTDTRNIGAFVGITSGKGLSNCSAINITVIGGNGRLSSLYYSNMYGTVIACFTSAKLISSSGVGVFKKMSATPTAGVVVWTGYLFNENLNDGYPIQRSLLSIPSTQAGSEIYNYLVSLGFSVV